VSGLQSVTDLKFKKENRAREVKTFGGTPEKGCGKFLPIKE